MTSQVSFGETLTRLTSATDRLCVGIDPHGDILRAWGLPDTADGALSMGQIVVQQVLESGVSLVKPQVAFFERHGNRGMAALATLIQVAREAGVTVIADAKRGDVGSTVSAYASAWLTPGSDFEADALTAVAYQGVGSVEPMCEAAEQHEKGLFVLVNTSNPDGWDIQAARVATGETVAQHVFDGLVDRQKSSPLSGWLGAVIGATLSPTRRSVSPADGGGLWILAPGFGHQGAHLRDLVSLFGDASSRVIPTVSRSVTVDGPEGVASRITAHRQELAS